MRPILQTTLPLLRALALVLVFVPFVASQFLASGTMARAAAGGGVEVVLCTGDGIERFVMDASGELTPAPDHGDGSLCPWAMVVQTVVQPEAATAAVATLVAPDRIVAQLSSLPFCGHVAPCPQSRAPPVSV